MVLSTALTCCNTLAVLSRIGSGLTEHSCLFPTEVIAKTLSARKRSKTTSEIMWIDGSTGHRPTNWVSSAWKILSSSPAVRWPCHGLPPRLWTTLWRQKFLWREERLVMLGPVSLGATFGDAWRITTVVSTQFVLQTTFTRHELTLLLLLYGKQNPPMLADQCVFIRGFRAKRILFWGKRIHHPAAELWPDDPDNRREDEIQVSRVPVTPKVDRLPL